MRGRQHDHSLHAHVNLWRLHKIACLYIKLNKLYVLDILKPVIQRKSFGEACSKTDARLRFSHNDKAKTYWDQSYVVIEQLAIDQLCDSVRLSSICYNSAYLYHSTPFTEQSSDDGWSMDHFLPTRLIVGQVTYET